MKYFFSEIDEITLTFNDICATGDGMEYIRIYFERPKEGGFDFLESSLPRSMSKLAAASIKTNERNFWTTPERMPS